MTASLLHPGPKRHLLDIGDQRERERERERERLYVGAVIPLSNLNRVSFRGGKGGICPPPLENDLPP